MKVIVMVKYFFVDVFTVMSIRIHTANIFTLKELIFVNFQFLFIVYKRCIHIFLNVWIPKVQIKRIMFLLGLLLLMERNYFTSFDC
jgi:hypothetical protein